MSRRKHGVRDLAQGSTRIMLTEEGTSGLKAFSGFVAEAYNQKLYWPQVQPIYNKLRRSMAEMVIIRQAFSTWARNVTIRVDLPENPTDDDTRYQKFIESVFSEMTGGFGGLIDTLLNNVPFFGWGWWTVVPGRRDPDWTDPDGDGWKSESDDGLIGLRRLAFRDSSSFQRWDMDDRNHLRGMWQQDFSTGTQAVLLPLEQSLHITFGDPNNPEGLSPLEAIYRISQIKYGLEVVQGIGFEHAAGYLNIKKTNEGSLSADDKTNIALVAKAILTAQQGNYAAWPFGIEGEVKDIGFAAAGSLLSAIQYYGVLALSCYTMQWIALSATTGAGSYAAMTDSSTMGVFTFNSMLDGFATQFDAQVGKQLYEWNKAAFPNLTKRPEIHFTHIEKELALGELSAFIVAMADILKLGPDDIKAIRERVPFLPKEQTGDQVQATSDETTPEQAAAVTAQTINQALNVFRANRLAELEQR